MSTVQSLRCALIEILTDYKSDRFEKLFSVLIDFIDNYGKENGYKHKIAPVDLLSDLLKTPKKKSDSIHPPRWNTPVSPFTGVAMDGSDGEIHAPLSSTSPPINYELFLAIKLRESLVHGNRSTESLLPILIAARDDCI